MKKGAGGVKVATFSFDVESSRWTRHGAWGLPFKGRGYFVADLDAWAGLSGDPGTLGHICDSDVLSAGNGNCDGRPPAWKLSKEKLFCVDDPGEKHTGATLVYLGDDRAMFCLVQCFSVDDRQGGIWKESMPEQRRYLLRVKHFRSSMTNVETCELRHYQIGSYRLPEIATVYSDGLQRPVAFWI
ncbi:unnamed protein product [Urochloa humidicola]